MKINCLMVCFALILFSGSAIAQDAPEQDKKTEPEVIVEGLNNPFALAIQPGTGHIFVSDSGAMRVVRIVDKKIEPVITGFSKSSFGTADPMDVGPMGLAFLDQNTLVVAGGRDEKGHMSVGIYKVPAAGKEAITADKAEKICGLVTKDDAKVDPGIGYSMLATGEGVYLTTTVDPAKGWLLHADRAAESLTDFNNLVATSEVTGVGMPIALTNSTDAGYLVVGEIGSLDNAGDSLLSFYDESGSLLGKYSTGLSDICALAYGPKRRRLFALDYSAVDAEKSGLFKLIADGTDGCKAIPMAELKKPTAMAFDPQGKLYITVRADAEDGSPNGKLLMISGLDDPPKKK